MAAKKFDPSIPTIEELERFAAISPGTPFPRSREAWLGLPDTVRMVANGAFPELVEAHQADAGRLPADVEIRLQRNALTRADVAALEQAGYAATAQQVEKQAREAQFKAWEEQAAASSAALAEASQRQQEEWSEMQRVGLERAQAEARSKWVSSIGSGQPSPLVQQAIALGRVAPGPR